MCRDSRSLRPWRGRGSFKRKAAPASGAASDGAQGEGAAIRGAPGRALPLDFGKSYGGLLGIFGAFQSIFNFASRLIDSGQLGIAKGGSGRGWKGEGAGGCGKRARDRRPRCTGRRKGGCCPTRAGHCRPPGRRRFLAGGPVEAVTNLLQKGFHRRKSLMEMERAKGFETAVGRIVRAIRCHWVPLGSRFGPL